MSKTTLKWNADVVRALVDATNQGTNHEAPYGIGDPVPGLFFVKDDGIYLMPNREYKGTTPREAGEVAYAKGYHPSTPDCWDKCRDAVGGDDFAELLPSTDLIAPDGAVEFFIKVSEDTLEIGWMVMS